MKGALDRRLYAYRDDLADQELSKKVKARKFVPGEDYYVKSSLADLRPNPDLKSGIDTQLLFGDMVRVFELANSWAWVQSVDDRYVGYTQKRNLKKISSRNKAPTHRVSAVRSFRYAQPDLKTPIVDCLSLGSNLCVVDNVENRGTNYAKLTDSSYMIARHIAEISDRSNDYVAIAEQLTRTPYLWGGTSAHGLDCSGLVQLSMRMAGKKVLRDTDMQEKSIGEELGFAAMDGGLQRGDLIFWKGHVGIMQNATTLIHANGHTMDVASEPLDEAIERIGYLYGFPTTLRRPEPSGS